MARTLLFLHLLSAFVLVAGIAVAGVGQLSAMRHQRPSEIALLLRVARIGALLVNVGALGALVFGIALAEKLDVGLGTGWVSAAIVLWVVATALGGVGGRRASQARQLADRLAAEGNRPSGELGSLVSHRPSLLLSYASSAVILAIIVVMVWKPGS